jgi:hypothetical protein
MSVLFFATITGEIVGGGLKGFRLGLEEVKVVSGDDADENDEWAALGRDGLKRAGARPAKGLGFTVKVLLLLVRGGEDRNGSNGVGFDPNSLLAVGVTGGCVLKG